MMPPAHASSQTRRVLPMGRCRREAARSRRLVRTRGIAYALEGRSVPLSAAMISFALLLPLCLTPASSTPVVAPRAQAPDERPAPPAEPELAASRAKVLLIFEDDLAEARGDRDKSGELASTMLVLTAEMEDEPIDRYAVLVESQVLAEYALDLSLVEVIVKTMDLNFRDIDPTGRKADALLRMWPDMRKDQRDLAVPLGLDLVRALLEGGDLERATGVLATVKAKARRHPDPSTRETLDDLTDRLEAAQRIVIARKTLAEDPEDPSSNDLLGRYHALVLGDLEGALAHLRLGESPDLLACVEADVAGPEEPGPRAELARSWTLLANRDSDAEPAALARAAHWYGRAIEQLGTLDRIPLRKRLESVEKRLAGLEGATPPVEIAEPAAVEPVLEIADRATGRLKLKRTAGRSMDQALNGALTWLAAHQAPNGSWSGILNAEGTSACKGEDGEWCSGSDVEAGHEVGLTGLALMALLGEGKIPGAGDHGEVVAKGVAWLQAQADPRTGLIGDMIGYAYLYDHAVATIALCEAYIAGGGQELKATCQQAVDCILRARNADGAWRYELPASGDNDTSVTGWMVTALKTAEEAGLEVDEGAYEGALSWFDKVSDPETGRMGYSELGGVSSRVTGVNDHYPREIGEAMTAAGLLGRIFSGQTDPAEYPILEKHGDLMLRTLPEWNPDDFANDMYYWYYGSHAMYQLGGKYWKSWASALKDTVEAAQRELGCEQGSFDPIGPWGHKGGRVYATAMMALCIESHFRYARLVD